MARRRRLLLREHAMEESAPTVEHANPVSGAQAPRDLPPYATRECLLIPEKKNALLFTKTQGTIFIVICFVLFFTSDVGCDIEKE